MAEAESVTTAMRHRLVFTDFHQLSLTRFCANIRWRQLRAGMHMHTQV
jgi:hypothetical protein